MIDQYNREWKETMMSNNNERVDAEGFHYKKYIPKEEAQNIAVKDEHFSPNNPKKGGS